MRFFGGPHLPGNYEEIIGIFTFLRIAFDNGPSAQLFTDHARMKAHGAIGMQGKERFIVGESKNIAHKPRWGRMMQVKGNDAGNFWWFFESLKLDLENVEKLWSIFLLIIWVCFG